MLAPRHARRAAHAWRTTSDFARTGAEVASTPTTTTSSTGPSPTGLTMSGGRVWRSAYVDRQLDCWASVGFGPRGRVAMFDLRGRYVRPAPEPGCRGGLRLAARAGQQEVLPLTAPRHALVPNPASLVGVSADRRTLYPDGGQRPRGRQQGMTCMDAARVLRDLGASDGST